MTLPIQHIDIGAITQRVVFELPAGSTLASVVADGIIAAWTLGVITAKWGNSRNGPFLAFASGEASDTTLGPDEDSIAWLNVQGKRYLAFEVTTAEAVTPEWVRLTVEVDAA